METETLRGGQEDKRVKVRIQTRFALSPGLFSKATGIMSWVFKNVYPINKVEILSLCP